MEKLNHDELFLIAIKLDLLELQALCSVSKRVKSLIYNRDEIWKHKLNKEFPQYSDFERQRTLKSRYELLHSLFSVKESFNSHLELEKIYILKSLKPYKTILNSLPENIGNLPNLQDLLLSYNNITSLPKSIGNLSSLTRLYLDDNKLTSLPESIGNLTNLKRFALCCNDLTSLPESIGKLTNLLAFHLGNNKLVSLPESIGNLSKLKMLILRSNQLRSLPESIGNLSNLQELYLRYNQINILPKSVENLSRIQAIEIDKKVKIPFKFKFKKWNKIDQR